MKLNSKSINYNVQTVDELVSLDGLEGDTVVVTDENRGGVFVYREDNVGTNNGGTIFNGWNRQYDGAVNVKWFGAVGDGVTDDTLSINTAINVAKYDVYFPTATYLTTGIDLSQRTSELLLELNNSVLSQGCQYARLTADASIVKTLGQTAVFQVESGHTIKVGTQIRSSYGLGDTEGTGGAYVTATTDQSITVQYGENHSTYDNSTITVYDGAYIGNFEWSAFIGGNNVKVTIQNGTISESRGYFYANASAEICSKNILFTKRGLDGFNGSSPSCLYSFYNCSFVGSMDVAKQTFFMLNGASLRFRDCLFNSSNYDPEITFNGNQVGYESSYSSLYMENCVLDGTNTTINTVGAPYSSNNLHAIIFDSYYGEVKIMDIEIYNTEVHNYVRGLIGTSVIDLTHNITLGKVVINGVRCNVPFGIMKVYNVIVNCTGFYVSDSVFFMDNSSYLNTSFTQFKINPLNGSVFTALWNNCTFRFQNYGGYFANSHLDSCIFDSCKLITNDYHKVSFDNLYMRGTGTGIKISPNYDNDFLGGTDGLITIDSTDFPLNITNIFEAVYDRYAQLCDIKSIKGGATYSVSVFDSSITLSGTFRVGASGVVNGSFKGDDWFVPDNSSIFIMSKLLGVTSMCFPVTSSTNYAAGTTSIVTTGYAGYPSYRPGAGHYINIVLDDGEVFTTTIASIGANGNYINLTSALPSALSAGNNICPFRLGLLTYS